MNNEHIQEKDSTEYLGVILDRKLNWKPHINRIKLRLSKGIGILHREPIFCIHTIKCKLLLIELGKCSSYNLKTY